MTRTSPPAVWTKQLWMDPVTENPAVGHTEVWEIYNTTADAHPMHIHEVAFEVVNRQDIVVDEETMEVQVAPGSAPTPPEPWETGFKDTVIAYPGQVTRVRVRFDTPGPVRVALPHRRTRGQRDDAPLPHRPGPARPARHRRVSRPIGQPMGPRPASPLTNPETDQSPHLAARDCVTGSP